MMRLWRQLGNHEASESIFEATISKERIRELRSVYQHTNKSENVFLLKMMYQLD